MTTKGEARVEKAKTDGVVCCPVEVPARLAKAACDYAGRFKALSDETRLRILGLLAAAEQDLCACEIEASFDLAQPTISHHLRILREAGLIRGSKRGPWVYYALERKAFGFLKELRGILKD